MRFSVRRGFAVSILLFEDATCNALAPVTTGRLAATITCGGWRLIDLVGEFDVPLYGMCRPYLGDLQSADLPQLSTTAAGEQRCRLMLSSRTIPSQANRRVIDRLLRLPPQPEPVAITHRDLVVAIIDPPWSLRQLLAAGYEDLPTRLQSARDFKRAIDIDAELTLSAFELPHEIVAGNMKIINDNLEHRLARGDYRQLKDGVFVKEGCKLGEHLVFDTGSGPIVLEERVSVGPYTLLRGPIHIGAGSKILEHSSIKDQVSAGHTTKLGGEVEASVIEPYTNKQHHGFLGHSYLGSWINLGAGTCNSDLKNTYGMVNMEYPVGKASTGMQFLGCIMGDYSKSAINTGIFTGKVIGVCSMMYGFVTSNVPSFTNYARLFGQIATLPPEVMISTQERVFARRSVKQRPIDIQLILDMFHLTATERSDIVD